MRNLFLIKIQESEYIEDMYSNEYLYFSWLNNFKQKGTEQKGRFDPRELIVETKQIKTASIEIQGQMVNLHEEFNKFSGQYNIYLEDAKINCCSLYWLEVNTGQSAPSFNQKYLEMGDKILIIYNYRRFFELLDENIEKLGYQYSRKKVIYYNPKKCNGALTLHQKDVSYKYQNEYRILIGPTNKEGVKIPIPGLQKISLVADAKDLSKLKVEIENIQND